MYDIDPISNKPYKMEEDFVLTELKPSHLKSPRLKPWVKNALMRIPDEVVCDVNRLSFSDVKITRPLYETIRWWVSSNGLASWHQNKSHGKPIYRTYTTRFQARAYKKNGKEYAYISSRGTPGFENDWRNPKIPTPSFEAIVRTCIARYPSEILNINVKVNPEIPQLSEWEILIG